MLWVAVNMDGSEFAFLEEEPVRKESSYWEHEGAYEEHEIVLLNGSIEKILGRKLTWEDEPVKLKEEIK